MARLASDTNLDIIIRHYKDHSTDELNEVQQKMLERWNFVDNLMRNYEDRETVLSMLKEKFNISIGQCWRDIANAKLFFGTININDKPYYKIYYAEWLEQLAKESHAAGERKVAKECLREAAEIRGLKDEDFDADKYRKREHHTFVININSSGSKAAKKIDLDKIQDVPETEFEEIIENVENSSSVSEEEMQKMLDQKHGGS